MIFFAILSYELVTRKHLYSEKKQLKAIEIKNLKWLSAILDPPSWIRHLGSAILDPPSWIAIFVEN